MTKTVEEILDMIPAGAFRQDGKFQSKLTFAERCEVLALYRSGVSRAALYEAFGVDRRTITHIYTRHSPHYKNVRDEEERLGRQEFCKQYITEEGAKKVAAIRQHEPDDPNVPNKAAAKHRGTHLVKTDATEFEHRIVIDWRSDMDEEIGAGWYFRDLDGPEPNKWFHNGDESRRTSQECLKAVKETLFDV